MDVAPQEFENYEIKIPKIPYVSHQHTVHGWRKKHGPPAFGFRKPRLPQFQFSPTASQNRLHEAEAAQAGDRAEG